MKRFSTRRRVAFVAAAMAVLVPAAVLAAAPMIGKDTKSEHWGVVARNTIGSPVAQLRDGPYVPGPAGEPPFGKGSLGIEVADNATTQSPPSEKVDFGNEVDFLGDPLLALSQVGFYVYQTGENIGYGGPNNLPNIRFEIDPNLTANSSNFTTLVWVPNGSGLTPNQWSGYIDATTNGFWYMTGAAGTATGCAAACSFTGMKTALNDGGDAPVILSVAVGKGRDSMWIGAVDGLRINERTYDFEADGVKRKDAK